MSRNIKFGLSLDLVELDHQEPNRNQRESKYYWDELFSLIPAAGFTGIELPYQPKWDFGGRSGVPLSQYAIKTKYGSVKNFKAALKANGIEQIAGVYFNPSLFISSNSDAYFGAFAHFAAEAVQFVAEADASILTLTPTPCIGLLKYHFEKGSNWTAVRTDFLKKTAELINRQAEIAAGCGITIALKNEYWSVIRETGREAFYELLDDRIRLNIDTAHSQIAGDSPVEQITAEADRIGSVHFTDTAFVDTNETWREVNPQYPSKAATQVFRDIGQGTVDLPAAYQALKAVEYGGWVICSCRQTRDAMRAMLRSRHQIDQMILQEKGGAL